MSIPLFPRRPTERELSLRVETHVGLAALLMLLQARSLVVIARAVLWDVVHTVDGCRSMAA